jgi:hypothetical protein
LPLVTIAALVLLDIDLHAVFRQKVHQNILPLLDYHEPCPELLSSTYHITACRFAYADTSPIESRRVPWRVIASIRDVEQSAGDDIALVVPRSPLKYRP